jgi:hypothetical protein
MSNRRAVVVNAALDAASIVGFAAIGRRNHGEATTLGGIVEVAWPFLAAAAFGWAAGRVWRAPGAVRCGLVVWVVTVVLGMGLRHVVAGRGTAAPFVVVATIFLGLVLVVRRGVVALVARRQDRFVAAPSE